MVTRVEGTAGPRYGCLRVDHDALERRLAFLALRFGQQANDRPPPISLKARTIDKAPSSLNTPEVVFPTTPPVLSPA